LEKHGLLLHWDGHGTLTGVEIKSDDAFAVRVREEE
jgi:hypothetical protein